VRDVAVCTNERYADQLTAEAVLTAQAVYPDTHRLVFLLGDDVTGTAYDRAGCPVPGARRWDLRAAEVGAAMCGELRVRVEALARTLGGADRRR
jgi:hypothetical protein